MIPKWSERLGEYLQDIAGTIDRIDKLLERTGRHTIAGDNAAVEQSTQELKDALRDLEGKVARREELLRADDAPRRGATLSEKVKSLIRHYDGKTIDAESDPLAAHHAELAEMCRETGKRIELANQRAIAMFVCQYHLADWSSEVLRILSGATAPATYSDQGNQGQEPAGGGGTLFNEAA